VSSAHPRDWGEIKAVFQQAIELSPEKRDAFLAHACGDDAELRAEVESLLASHEDERPFLEAPPIAGAGRVFADALDDANEPSTTELPTDTRIGQYEVLERLGSGGMGDVYRAHDTKLDRSVALKIVHDSAAGRTAERVLREARAASALNHPNICTIYEVGEFEGRPYLAMEYIAGQPLNGLIPSEGLPAADVVKYGAQIADALAHAHEHGVIHRDLKGANLVMTPEGRAKVLDFGLARRTAVAGASSISGTWPQAGTIAGTPAYMAPELLRNEKADARSDIWALGVLLYEMASGRRPFEGETPFEVTSAILKDTALPLPSRVPEALRMTIFRCLARDPGDRFQRASDLVTALEAGRPPTFTVAFRSIRISRRSLFRVAAVAALFVVAYTGYQWRAPRVPVSVAVLPFRVLSAAEEIGFLGIGVPDAIISRLTLVSGLRVRAALDKDRVDLVQAGRELGVNYVLTGTIQKDADQIRITPQLVSVDDGFAVRMTPHTLSSTKLLTLQDEIADAVVDSLPVEMTGDERTRVRAQHTKNSEAYALYVRGRAQLRGNNVDSTEAAVKSFQAAVDLDRTYALAHAGLAMASARMLLFFATEEENSTWYGRAHTAAQEATKLAPGLAESHEALAAVYRFAEFDWPLALQESAQALALNSNLYLPHLYRASAFFHLGLLDRVTPELLAAIERNPGDLEARRVEGFTALVDGRFKDAVRFLEEARGIKGTAEWNLAYAYYYAGQEAEAEAMLRQPYRSARTGRRAQATLASFLAAKGEMAATAEAKELIRVVTGAPYEDHHVAYALGAAYAQLNMPTEAIEWLQKARTRGFPNYPWYERDRLLAPLKQNASFERFLRDFKQSWETMKAQYETER
jgi:eukaryotic-like serine/threonine-protein kinase